MTQTDKQRQQHARDDQAARIARVSKPLAAAMLAAYANAQDATLIADACAAWLIIGDEIADARRMLARAAENDEL